MGVRGEVNQLQCLVAIACLPISNPGLILSPGRRIQSKCLSSAPTFLALSVPMLI